MAVPAYSRNTRCHAVWLGTTRGDEYASTGRLFCFFQPKYWVVHPQIFVPHIKLLSSLGGFIASAYYPGANPTPGWEPYPTDSLLPRSFTLTAIFPSTKENSHAFPRLADWYHWLHPAVEGTGKLDPGLGREGLPA